MDAGRWNLGRRNLGGGNPGEESGFTLIEILVATVIAGILFAMVAQMIQTWAKATAVAAAKARRTQAEQDMRRLYAAVVARYAGSGFPNVGPWPKQIPRAAPVPWERPAPGFEELPWAPSSSPTHLQFRVDGWATGFNVSAIGDLDKDGSMELYRIWGDVGMFEGPQPYPPVESSPVSP